jgi:glucose-1-phosphate thymidylyltransferase
MIKGIILAGGMGTRLNPLTKVTNKNLLPIYNKPMIYWPIKTLVESGIKDVLLVSGGNNVGSFLSTLGDGKELGLRTLNYAYQKEPNGIADALSLAKEWVGDSPICVILGDNIFEHPVPKAIQSFTENPTGAQIFTYKSENPECYGVAEVNENNEVVSIVEKPSNPKSNLAVVGLYLYDKHIWEHINSLCPSWRGELEITDVNNQYILEGKLKANTIKGWWQDAGESIDTYLNTCIKVREFEQKTKQIHSEFPESP